MRLPVIVILLALVGVASVASAAPSIKHTGTFSDMAFNQDAGDVTGHELRIAFTSAGYEGVFQVAEGAPSELMLVKVVFDGNKLSFTLPAGSYAGSFSGIVDANGISGVLTHASGAQEKVVLPRRKSYWD